MTSTNRSKSTDLPISILRRTFLAVCFGVQVSTLWFSTAAAQSIESLRILTEPELLNDFTMPITNSYIERKATTLGMRYDPAKHQLKQTENGSAEWTALLRGGDKTISITVRASTDPFRAAGQGYGDMVISSQSPSEGDLEASAPLRWEGTDTRQQRLATQAVAIVASSDYFNEAQGLARGSIDDAFYNMDVMRFTTRALQESGEVNFFSEKMDFSDTRAFETRALIVQQLANTNQAIAAIPVTDQLPPNTLRIGQCQSGFLPGRAEVLSGEYPLYRTISGFQAAIDGYAMPDRLIRREFLSYIRNGSLASLLNDNGYFFDRIELFDFDSEYAQGKRDMIAINESINPQARQDLSAVENAVGDLIQISRIIRFGNNSRNISGVANSDLNEVISFLKTNHPNTEVTLVGYASGDGSYTYNQQIAKARAEAVESYLKRHDIRVIRTLSAGEAGHLGCEEGGRADLLSRRVEIWIDR